MKAAELKYPYTWENRCPIMEKGVLFIPKYYETHTPFHLFEEGRRVFVEYCSGNGAWVLQKAKENPDVLWVAVERKLERVKKIWAKMHNQNISNLLIVCGDAVTFSEHYLPDHCIERIYVNFPDPWPKKKHAKNRLFQAPFVKALSRVVKFGGSAILVTDDLPYCLQMLETMMVEWDSVFDEPYFVTEWPSYGDSYFDSLWRAKDRTIHYLHFKNRLS